VFVKAVGTSVNPQSPDLVRREITNVAALPPGIAAPALVTTYDDGEWVACAFELVDGSTPTLPWRAPLLDAAFALLAGLGRQPAPPIVPAAADRFATTFDGWTALAAGPSPVDGRWAPLLPTLVDLERAALTAVGGDRLVHTDIRSDNIVVDGDGQLWLVDWPHAVAGAPWLDLVLWLPALGLEGGGPPEEALARATACGVPLPTPAQLRAVVAGLAGFFLHRSGLPAPQGLPDLRPFQLAQAEVALAWLARLLDDDGGDDDDG
jgi:aminoglycoside phosphotransferase (APT) family kinase protein